jgi:hypothetical protein
MKSLKLKLVVLSLAFLACAIAAGDRGRAQQTRTTPKPQADIKVTYKVTMSSGGTAMPAAESTSMIKGVRERTEDHRGYGMDSVNITQCDLKRTIQLNDKTRKYIVTPMETGESSASSTATAARPAAAEATRRGGVVTYITSSKDTGERKEMFGFQARHVKTSTRVESSPDACNNTKQRFEQDGWYIDLNVGLNCQLGRPAMGGNPMARGGCIDRIQYRHEGTGRIGFPLIETTTIYDQNDQPSFSTTKEVTELSRQPLDAALFDIPSGYAEARNWQELNGQPDTAAMMAQAMANRETSSEAPQNEKSGTAAEAKRPGTLRIGVAQINNRTNNSVSTDSLRDRLIGNIQGANLEAVPLNASTAFEADAEAKAKQCDFVLFTDIASLKLSAAKSFGGMLGRATGVGSGSLGKTEAKLEFKLVPVGETSPRLQASASGKEEGDEASAGAAIDAEAKAVISAAKKKN